MPAIDGEPGVSLDGFAEGLNHPGSPERGQSRRMTIGMPETPLDSLAGLPPRFVELDRRNDAPLTRAPGLAQRGFGCGIL